MRSHCLFLLVYMSAHYWGTSNSQSNETCSGGRNCSQVPDPTSHFLQCVGLSKTDTGKDHMNRLKEMVEASLDVYSFMRSSLSHVPLLSLQGALSLNPGMDPFQNEDLIQLWFSVKLKPLLKSISKPFLTCLSTKNFSCSTYQTVVRELSHHFSEMDPARQKWIYTFFMYPFLSGDGIAGCVRRNESSEEWLMKNFGAFSVKARMKDFSTFNMVFKGLEVLHLLSPEQKAELLLRPEVAGLDNATLSLIFQSLLTGGSGPRPTVGPGGSHNWSNSYSYPPNTSYDPNPYLPASPQDTLRNVANGVMVAMRPFGSLIHEFVSLTRERSVSEIRSTTLTQVMLNWTLAELASMFRPPNNTPTFDVTNVDDWYQQVVMPILRRFLTDQEAMMHKNITLAFHHVFYMDNGMDNDTSEVQDICSITLDERTCALTDAVKNVAHVLHCAVRSNLTMSEQTIIRMVFELTKPFDALVQEFSRTNVSEVVSHFQEVFGQVDSPSLTPDNLVDPQFIKHWFRIKLLPILPEIPISLLSCLSTKNFTCPVYQTIVAELSRYMHHMDDDLEYSHNIYKHFIYPFLMHHNTSDLQCVSSANNSEKWLEKNFGFFSRFAPLKDFYKLSPYFSGVEVLHRLSPMQLAEILVLPLRSPPEKEEIISRVFDFLIQSPEDRKLLKVLHILVELAEEIGLPCRSYKLIFEQIHRAIPSVSPDMEPAVWANIDALRAIAPEECVPLNITCPTTLYNSSAICSGVNSSELQHYLNTSASAGVPCTFPLEEYACAQLENFTANQMVSLLKCDLPGASSHSKMLWKMLLSKLSFVLTPALDIMASTSTFSVSQSASEILDVIGEIKVSMLSDEQLRNSSIIRKWFSHRLRGFLPFASARLLRCLSNRNLSCQSFQIILQELSHQFDNMTSRQQHLVFKELIIPFLSHPQSGPGCVSNSNSSADWLRKDFGPFSVFASVHHLLQLNPNFKPLEVLSLLSPHQIAELVVLNSTLLPSKEVIINMLFDYLTEAQAERKLPEFLFYLNLFLSKGNLSCSEFKTLFNRMDLATGAVRLDIAHAISYGKVTLSRHIPPGCIIYAGKCNLTMTNETDICVGVNSTMLQLGLDNGQMTGRFCDFSIEEFACASLSALKAQDLVEILKCRRSNSSSSRPTWKLLLSKASLVLDEALDLLSNTTLDLSDPAVRMILDCIREIRLDLADLNHAPTLQLWFDRRLRPFLPALSNDFLACIATENLTCRTYQNIVQILSTLQPYMDRSRQMSVYTHFIKVFLSRNNTADPQCRSNTQNSSEWLRRNIGGFSALVSFRELRKLNSNFSAMEALPQLTVRQLAEFSSTPGELTSPVDVPVVMAHVPNNLLPVFFDDYSPAIMGHVSEFPPAVRSAMLQVVFDRANLTDSTTSNSVVLDWLHNRLRPLLVGLSPLHVAPFFKILSDRGCSLEHQGIIELNSTISTLGGDASKQIHNHIIQSLRAATPLHCYGDNYNHSFFRFLESSFLGFQFPNLTAIISLMPHDQMHQLVNSIPPPQLSELLSRQGIVDNDAELCQIYSNYDETPTFLETEALPVDVRRPTLPCVWPLAVSSSQRLEVNAWFDQRLKNYTAFLNKPLLTSNTTHNATCLAFQKLVSLLVNFDYATADFVRQDVFDVIKAYLTSATVPKCYNADNPDLNSTAWFAEYMGPFLSFLTLDDFLTLGSAQVIQVFTVNLQNIALLNHTTLPVNLTNYYVELIYQQDSNFNPLHLPLFLRCVAPGPAFSQLTQEESTMVLHNLTTLCDSLDPQVAAALASTFGERIGYETIMALGMESSGISMGQLRMIQPGVLHTALITLSRVTNWNQGQAASIVQVLLASGMLQLNSTSSLLLLGTLSKGIPSTAISTLSGPELIAASNNPTFLNNVVLGLESLQQTIVAQIISVNNNKDAIIQNVPDEMAGSIPRVLLSGFTNDASVVSTINKKKWKRQQVELFFDSVVLGFDDPSLGGLNNVSSNVLQGFTCTRSTILTTVKVKKVVKACRRKGKRRVKLVETQLTCMYNYIKGDADVTSYDLFPPDVLLYYDYSLVPQTSCRSYFEQLGNADFSVFSTVLSYKTDELFSNAQTCLGITSTTLTKDNVAVLGDMCCILDGVYIANSDPSILEKLKNCPDLTNSQAAAVETLLMSGTTKYGPLSTWDEQTLKDLGMLPLYLSDTFYDNFKKKTKRKFLRYFLKVLRSNGVSRAKKKTFKRAIKKSYSRRKTRSIANECTVGKITQVTISDPTFPLDYNDVAQFNSCLSAKTVKFSLPAITEKVDEEEFLRVVLNKLQEAYTADIPEYQVKIFGPTSRVATSDDITRWTITELDTLSALMNSSYGQWDPSLAKAIIVKYLSKKGNTLGSMELNAIGGENLCSLDSAILQNISQDALKNAEALTLSNCTLEKKQNMFNLALGTFSSTTRSTISPSVYQLMIPFLSGASLDFIKTLADISMDLPTFVSLDESVIPNLTVPEVQNLLGRNLPVLKLYENQTVVRSWRSQQFQSELDKLDIGLSGGKPDPTATTATTASTAIEAPTATGATTVTTIPTPLNTTGNAVRIRADTGLSLLVLLVLFMNSLHILR
ncbi:uncharacterized protein LOC142996666 isoform X2 [Genypterus blacodes]|uniref:uncharacterized protein LOC142996666 isoform X2 n=1 Tax=Genypterus blacodes TaxID=154954 RepID=UPI003F76A262